MGNLRVLTNTYATALTTEQVVRKVLFPSCLIEHIPSSPIQMASLEVNYLTNETYAKLFSLISV